MIIRPDNKFHQVWEVLIFITTLVSAIHIPYKLFFFETEHGSVFNIELSIVSVFAIDLIKNFFLGYQKGRLFITDHKLIAIRYLKGWFFIDFLAIMPFIVVFIVIREGNEEAGEIFLLFRIFYLLRFPRIFKIIHHWQGRQFINPSIFRLTTFLFWMLLISHWIACGWLYIGEIPTELSESVRYIQSLYWTITTLTTVGYGDISPNPENIFQMIYTMLVMILGVGLYGYVIGNLSSLLANMDIAKSAYMKKMEQVNSFLAHHHVPSTLQERIRNYYKHLWEMPLGKDELSIINDLPKSLGADISMFLTKDILEKVPLFKDADENILREIASKLKPAVYTPGDFIIRKGETGEKMFFLINGNVEVIFDQPNLSPKTLTEGSFFGELALLFDRPRLASVRAVEYCNLYYFKKVDFKKITSHHPEFSQKIREVAEKRKSNRGIAP